MTGPLWVLLSIASILVAIPILIVAVECLVALVPAPAFPMGRRTKRAAIIIPAHDEEGSIVPTLRSIGPQLLPGDRILVVADNCADRTAECAREAGASVVE